MAPLVTDPVTLPAEREVHVTLWRGGGEGEEGGGGGGRGGGGKAGTT